MDDRHRHPRAVHGNGPVAAFDVVLGAVVAEHRLFAQQRPLTGGEVDVVDAHRGHEGRRTDPQLRRIPVGIAGKTRRRQLGFEGEVLRPTVGALGVERPQLDPRQRLAAIADHDVPDERVDRVETDVVAVLDERAGGCRVAHRRLDEGEVLGTVVVQDEEPVFAADDGMLDRVLDELAPWPHRNEFGVPVGGVGVADL